MNTSDLGTTVDLQVLNTEAATGEKHAKSEAGRVHSVDQSHVHARRSKIGSFLFSVNCCCMKCLDY